jgi:competence protein ComEC
VLHKEIPFLRIGLPLCAGIVCGYYIRPDNLFFLLSGIIITAGFLSGLFFNRHLSNPVYGISLTFALFILGILLFTKEKEDFSYLRSEVTFFSGYLSEYPEEKENTVKLYFRMESGIIRGDQTPAEGTLLLYHKKGPECLTYLPGDRLIIKCKPVEIANRGNPFEFDYRFYMENRGIRYYAFTDSSDIISHSVPIHRKMIHRALIIRERIIDMFRERGIEGDRLALVAAITLGQKNMLDPEQKQYFIRAGVMHIMAVSGLHAVILSLFVFKVLFFLKGRFNIFRVLITLLILWSFAFVTGLTPSVLRATLMFTFLQAGNIMKRPVNSINSVLASAFILILIRPSVIFDAGFLLSYSAVIFIISFYRDLYMKLRFRYRLPDLIWQSAAVSIIAQAGTLPLTIMLFNRFPTWFILSNIIIVPLSSLVIIVGCMIPLTFPLVFFSKLLAGLLDFLTGLTEFLTAKASSLPYATIENIGLTTLGCILLTITIFITLRFLLVKKSIPVLWPLTAILLLVLTGTIRDIITRTSSELIVYNSIGYSTIGIRTGKVLNIYSDTLITGQEVKRHCATLGLRTSHKLLSQKSCMIKTGESNTLITSFVNSTMIDKTKSDILIIQGKKTFLENDIHSVRNIKAVIVTSGINQNSQISRNVLSLLADTTHFVRKHGAFRMKL